MHGQDILNDQKYINVFKRLIQEFSVRPFLKYFLISKMNKHRSAFVLIENFYIHVHFVLIECEDIFLWRCFSTTKGLVPLTTFESNLKESHEKRVNCLFISKVC